MRFVGSGGGAVEADDDRVRVDLTTIRVAKQHAAAAHHRAGANHTSPYPFPYPSTFPYPSSFP